MQLLNIGEAYTNRTAATKLILIKYTNAAGQQQQRIEQLEYLQTFEATDPIKKCYLIN